MNRRLTPITSRTLTRHILFFTFKRITHVLHGGGLQPLLPTQVGFYTDRVGATILNPYPKNDRYLLQTYRHYYLHNLITKFDCRTAACVYNRKFKEDKHV